MNDVPIRWQFVETRTRKGGCRWIWHRLVINGEIAATSEPFDEFGAAVNDAIANGFKPKGERWVILSTTGATLFDPVDGARVLEPGGAEAVTARKVRPHATAIRKRVPSGVEQSDRSPPPSAHRKPNGNPGKPKKNRPSAR
jgi:hypothetical protein